MGDFSRTRLARTDDVVNVVADVAAPAAITAATLTVVDGAGTNNNSIAAITDNASTIAAVQELADEINKLVADVTALRTTVAALRTALNTEA